MEMDEAFNSVEVGLPREAAAQPPDATDRPQAALAATLLASLQAKQTCGVSDDERERLDDGSHVANSVIRL